MFEIEQKFHISDCRELVEKLDAIGAILVSEKDNTDTYYNHPCRDFAQTGEALRVRREDGLPMVTYKGQKLPGDVKAREELEWRLDPGDTDGTLMERLLTQLGFHLVATVTKRRQTYRWGRSADPLTITIDEVPGLGSATAPGLFAEIETVLDSNAPAADEIEAARARVSELAERLGLNRPESRSYLRMILESGGGFR
jgi:adenylate cyclase class 2